MIPYQLSPRAKSDIEDILEYTFDSFGKRQMLKYKGQLEHCLKQLSSNLTSYRNLDIDGISIQSLHCQKHYIFAMDRQDRPLLIIAVLHEKMDLVKRLTNRL